MKILCNDALTLQLQVFIGADCVHYQFTSCPLKTHTFLSCFVIQNPDFVYSTSRFPVSMVFASLGQRMLEEPCKKQEPFPLSHVSVLLPGHMAQLPETQLPGVISLLMTGRLSGTHSSEFLSYPCQLFSAPWPQPVTFSGLL